ncbi:MAG: hypothetical protein QOJ43_225 [Gaiellaceae bacterium]|jgi:hypothetical protein|nr:hypothetical protein [Gaiellaceae bacterium]
MNTDSSRRRAIARFAIAVCAALVVIAAAPGAAGAASIAYVDGGDVWLSSLDGQQKVRLATPVVNADGDTEKWLAVAASDNGRIVAARNVPGRISRYSWFKVWEPNGTSTVEGPLNAPTGYTIYVYPLGFDLTADGAHMVYGYSNSNCCPYSLAEGTYVRPVTNSSADPINVSGQEDPTLFGNRMIAHSGTTVSVQGDPAPYGTSFTPWMYWSATPYEVRRADVAANGQLVATELEQWDGGSQSIGKIAVVAIQGVNQSPTFPASVDCFIPTAGVAKEASLSLDATRIAWTDDGGLKVAGTPTTVDDPCVLTSPPVVISPTASQGAIGGANVAAFLPTSGQPPAGGPPPGAPVATVPRKVTAKALAGAKGVAIKVKVAHAGKVTIAGSVPAKVLSASRSIVVARGSATAKRAGTVTVRLRLTTAARKKRSRLKGARMTLRVTQGKLSTTKRFTLR